MTESALTFQDPVAKLAHHALSAAVPEAAIRRPVADVVPAALASGGNGWQGWKDKGQ